MVVEDQFLVSLTTIDLLEGIGCEVVGPVASVAAAVELADSVVERGLDVLAALAQFALDADASFADLALEPFASRGAAAPRLAKEIGRAHV